MQPPVCQPHDIKERNSALVSFFHIVPAGISLDQVLAPSYWRNAWKMFERRVHSTIDLVADDGAWEAKVRVTAVAENVVRLRVLSRWTPEAPIKEAPDGVKIEHLPSFGWRAVAADGVTLAEGLPSRDEAIAAASTSGRASAAPRKTVKA